MGRYNGPRAQTFTCNQSNYIFSPYSLDFLSHKRINRLAKISDFILVRKPIRCSSSLDRPMPVRLFYPQERCQQTEPASYYLADGT